MTTSNITGDRPVNFQNPSEPTTHNNGLNKIKKVALIALGALALAIGAGLLITGAIMSGFLPLVVSGAALVITGIALLIIGLKSQQPAPPNTGVPSQSITSQLDEMLEQIDRERAAKLLSEHPEFLGFLSDEVEKNPGLYAGINEELSEDTLYKFLRLKSVALVSVTRNVEYYQFLTLRIREDIDVALLAVRGSNDASILDDIPLKAKEDIRVAREYVQKYPQGYEDLPLKSRENAEVTLLAVRGSNDASILDDIPLKAKEDIRVAREYVQKYPHKFDDLPYAARNALKSEMQ